MRPPAAGPINPGDKMIADAIRAAWYAVTSNRVRTLLTVGSVAVGVCAVVLMSSLAGRAWSP